MICVVSKKCLDGEIQIIPYEDIVIICNKTRKHLKPNIYVNTKFLSIGETIRGNILIACKENENFKTLTKSQAMKYIEFLKEASFHYDNIDETGKLIDKRIFKTFLNDYKDIDINKNNNDEVLKMILGIQTIILKFIKNNEN